MRKHFTEAAPERCSSNLCLAAFKNVFHLKVSVKKSNFQTGSNVMLRDNFSLKHLLMATGNF